jgi:uncharacterized protein (DUF2147 family)
MRHHAFTVGVGTLMAAALVPLSANQASAADPTGIWRKADQGERPGKIEVYRCGSGRRYICAKIVWLQDPNDSNGRPLRDVRNENPSLRGRAIMGLPIIRGMAPVGANQWKGNIYNPEDGNTYSATLTLVSRNQINLKGCKAWLLCGERTWLRTTLPKPEAEPEPQIEASAEPEPAAAPETTTASAEPEADDSFANAEMMTPTASQSTQPGYRFLNATVETKTGFSGENVPSMFAMTKPIEAGDERPAAPVAQAAAPAAQAASEPQTGLTLQASAAPAAQPQAAAPNAQSAPPPSTPENAAEDTGDAVEEGTGTETAEAEVVDPRSLSWRERRQLRRQQRLQQQQQQGQGLLPWLR